MKVSIALIIISIWFLRVRVANANYRRIIRGPPQPHRPPGLPGPPHHAIKKWGMAPQRPQHPRLRPIPLHMPQKYKGPMGPIGPPLLPTRRPTTVRRPILNIWKNPQILNLSTEKPFLSSPTISLPEYDFHLQTNSIPHSNTVQQLDEKGPIHTIPAPNLSLADKPNNIEHVQSLQELMPDPLLNLKHIHQQQYQHQQIQQQQQQIQQQLQQKLQQQQQLQNTIVEVQKSHQYEVTETPLKLPLYFAPDPNPGHHNFRLKEANLINHPQAEFLTAPPGLPKNPLVQQDVFKLRNSFPQQQLVDTYNLPIVQQPQLQQYIHHQKPPTSYQAMISNVEVLPKNNLPNHPHFQLFNYDEQDQKYLPTNQISSRVTADYTIKPYDNDDTEKALAQTQFVQHFFDSGDENVNVANNDVETDADLKENEMSFFSTLPNKEAADTLASLQEAGQLNNKAHMNVEVSKQIPISIYVPDNDEDTEDKKNEYDEISMEEQNHANNYGRNNVFGNRLRIQS